LFLFDAKSVFCRPKLGTCVWRRHCCPRTTGDVFFGVQKLWDPCW